MEVRGKTVKLGFQFPKEATILRKELHQKITEQNIAATSPDADWLSLDIDIGLTDKPVKGEGDGGGS